MQSNPVILIAYKFFLGIFLLLFKVIFKMIFKVKLWVAVSNTFQLLQTNK